MKKELTKINLLKKHGEGFKIKIDNFEKFAWFISRWNTIRFPFTIFENKKDNIWYNEILLRKELILVEYNKEEESPSLKYIIGTIDLDNKRYMVGTNEEERDFGYNILTISDYTKYFIDRKNKLVYVINLTYNGTNEMGFPRLMYSVPMDIDMVNCRCDIEFIKLVIKSKKVNQLAYVNSWRRDMTVLTARKEDNTKILNIKAYGDMECSYDKDITYDWDTMAIRMDKPQLPNVMISGEKANVILSYERAGSHELYLYTDKGESLNISTQVEYIISEKVCKSIEDIVDVISTEVCELQQIESIKTISKTH
ncbi:MAG: hypothetical protein ACRCXX_12705 [Cetobacterium sp.]|uniref:hypothetical protein n=1 Tax=Cetobacterium sp. TaxID=2071632 RepID=UPI003F3E4C1E